MALLIAIIAIMAVALLTRFERRLREVESAVRELARTSGTSSAADPAAKAEEARARPALEEAVIATRSVASPLNPPLAKPPRRSDSTPPGPRRVPTDPPPVRSMASSPRTYAVEQRWRRLERQVVENWTGILGAVILVAGVTFVGGYTGLRLSPFYRSMMIAASGVLLLVGASALDRREAWHALSQWIRSAGAAVFLLACFGSSGIAGLAWLSGLGPSLAVLLVGIGVNLGVAYRAKEQVFASLHVVLSLLPLIIVPQSMVTLPVATLVAGAGVRLAWRPSWQLLVVVTLSTYAAFHVVWAIQILQADSGVLSRWMGVATVGVVCALVAFRQYGRVATGVSGPTALDLVAHVASWVFFSVALAGYASSATLRSTLLLATAGGAYLLGRRALGASVRRLYVADTLVAEGLALWGLVSLHAVVFHWLLIPALAFAMSALFHRVGVTADEPLLERCGSYALRLSAVAVLISGLVSLDPIGPLGIQHSATLFATALFGATYHAYQFRVARGTGEGGGETGETPSYASGAFVTAVTAGLLALLGAVNMYGRGWMTWAGVQAGLVILAAARRIDSRLLALGAFAVLLPIFPLAWLDLLTQHPLPVSEQVETHLLALALAGPLAILLASPGSVGPRFREVAIYATGLAVVVAEYTLLQPLSPYLPSAAWLMTSLIALEIARRSGASANHVLRVAWVHLLFFGFAYLLVIVPSEEMLGWVRVRLLVDLLAVLVLARWWMLPESPSLETVPSWRVTQPLALEAMVALAGMMVLLEVPLAWRPLAWATVAVVGVAAGAQRSAMSRLRLYSVGFFWLASYGLVVAGVGSSSSGGALGTSSELLGLAAIGVQIGYLLGLARSLRLTEVHLPPAISGLRDVVVGLAGSLSIALYYPFFAGVTVSLYLQFDAALLTLLWALEAFAVFAVSLLLRESHFRYTALVALGAVLVRLLVFDLSQSNLGVRGVIFIGVGALMLGMNSLYSRYKDRYA